MQVSARRLLQAICKLLKVGAMVVAVGRPIRNKVAGDEEANDIVYE
jgi:hypothetical protein